eukprot:TRINITY_DN956_c0_g1_i5.p1 TRINITY_DN956_c0_g1~~TRINITY_DN956_c0_g1_i5.p1  ORF type:complete len:413 (+),score=142.93 TRINITY_DN956_c0_g1_i5:112-1350(+)
MCEHLEERVSERLLRAQNQPRQRGYVGGTHQRGTQGVGKNGYGIKTLIGNWAEEQRDTQFCSRRAALLSDRERREACGRVAVTAGIGERGMPPAASIQPEMCEIINRSGRIFPGHQKEVDLHVSRGFPQWTSEAVATYTHPANRLTERPPRSGGRASGPQSREELLVQRVRSKILARGGRSGFRGIKRSLTIMDDNRNSKLSPEELSEGLAVYGVLLEPQELAAAFRHLDRDRSGQISVGEFLRGIRGGMSDRRLKLVRLAYKQLDRNCDGAVTFEDVRSAYDASHHPAVLSGQETEEDVLREFIADWDKDGDGDISLDEFVDYYEDISAGIDNEQYFELMVRNAWHISGGCGAAANTSCRRVLVVHTNGRQSVEEIKNDLGIGPTDIDKMIANLRAQGINDISRIELKGVP